jgi:hypothetical protein
MDVTFQIIQSGRALQRSHAACTYDEIRPMQFLRKARNRQTPWIGDCSTFYTWCRWMAHGIDPNGFGFNGSGNTASMVASKVGHQIPLKDVHPGDAVFFGNKIIDGIDWPDHVAMIVSTDGKDPLCLSMGQEGDPSYVRVSTMSSIGVIRYWRFPTRREGFFRRVKYLLKPTPIDARYMTGNPAMMTKPKPQE